MREDWAYAWRSGLRWDSTVPACILHKTSRLDISRVLWSPATSMACKGCRDDIRPWSSFRQGGSSEHPFGAQAFGCPEGKRNQAAERMTHARHPNRLEATLLTQSTPTARHGVADWVSIRYQRTMPWVARWARAWTLRHGEFARHRIGGSERTRGRWLISIHEFAVCACLHHRQDSVL